MSRRRKLSDALDNPDDQEWRAWKQQQNPLLQAQLNHYDHMQNIRAQEQSQWNWYKYGGGMQTGFTPGPLSGQLSSDFQDAQRYNEMRNLATQPWLDAGPIS